MIAIEETDFSQPCHRPGTVRGRALYHSLAHAVWHPVRILAPRPYYDRSVRLVVVTAGEGGRSQIVFDGPPAQARLLSGSPDALTAAFRTVSADHAVGPSETLVAELIGDSRVLPTGTFRSSPDRRRSLDLPAGANRWTFVSYGPGVTAGIHQTATVDYDMVVSGSVELLLDCGAVALARGDAVVLVGARHGWRTADQPCMLSIVMVGLPTDDTDE